MHKRTHRFARIASTALVYVMPALTKARVTMRGARPRPATQWIAMQGTSLLPFLPPPLLPSPLFFFFFFEKTCWTMSSQESMIPSGGGLPSSKARAYRDGRRRNVRTMRVRNCACRMFGVTERGEGKYDGAGGGIRLQTDRLT